MNTVKAIVKFAEVPKRSMQIKNYDNFISRKGFEML